jgi:hypothetical protein
MGLSQYPIQEVARAFRELRGGDPLPSFHTEGVVDVGPDPDVNPERVNLAPHQLRHLPKADPIPKRLTTIVEPWRRDMNLQQAHHPQAVGPLEGGKSVRLLLGLAFGSTSPDAPSARPGPSPGDASRSAGRPGSPPGRAHTLVAASSLRRSLLPDCSEGGRWRLPLHVRSER